MRMLNKLILRLRSLFRRDAVNHELDDELRSPPRPPNRSRTSPQECRPTKRATPRSANSAAWTKSERSAATCAT